MDPVAMTLATAEHRRGQSADLCRTAEGAPSDPCCHFHEHVRRASGQQQGPQKHIDRDDSRAHIREIAKDPGGRAVECLNRRPGRYPRRAPAPVDIIVTEVEIENRDQRQQGQEPADDPSRGLHRQQNGHQPDCFVEPTVLHHDVGIAISVDDHIETDAKGQQPERDVDRAFNPVAATGSGRPRGIEEKSPAQPESHENRALNQGLELSEEGVIKMQGDKRCEQSV